MVFVKYEPLTDSLQVYGKVDLEQPAPACEQTLVVVSHSLANGVVYNITIPLHSKYPHVTPNSNMSLLNWEGISGGFLRVDVPLPLIKLYGRTGQYAMVSHKLNQLEWAIPAGSAVHYSIVMYGTALIVAISAIIVAWGLLTIDLRPLQQKEL